MYVKASNSGVSLEIERGIAKEYVKNIRDAYATSWIGIPKHLDDALCEIEKQLEAVYYQPGPEELIDKGLPSNAVWADLKECQSRFPNAAIIQYSGDDIEDHEFFDDRFPKPTKNEESMYLDTINDPSEEEVAQTLARDGEDPRNSTFFGALVGYLHGRNNLKMNYEIFEENRVFTLTGTAEEIIKLLEVHACKDDIMAKINGNEVLVTFDSYKQDGEKVLVVVVDQDDDYFTVSPEDIIPQ